MSDGWVLNASPLILFSRIHQLDLIEKLSSEILVPEAVLEEIHAGEADDSSAGFAIAFAQTHRASDVPLPDTVSHWDLGAGESQVIAHALARSYWAVLDDLAARRCAITYKIPVVGSIGLVLRAKRLGLLPAAAPLLTDLKNAGLYASDEFIAQLLAIAGEARQIDPPR